MYCPSIDELKKFYKSPLGALAGRRLRRRIKNIWEDVFESKGKGKNIVLGVGYAAPYLVPLLKKKNYTPISYMPSKIGAAQWPKEKKNLSLMGDKFNMPFDDSSIDRVLLIHSLEYSDNPSHMMREIWRILAPEGRVLVIVPNRRSMWAKAEKTPFGHGMPFSYYQLKDLLEESMFLKTKTEFGLYLPPFETKFLLRTFAGIVEFLQNVSDKSRILKPRGGGVILMEAKKQIYATNEYKRKKKEALEPAYNQNGQGLKKG